MEQIFYLVLSVFLLIGSIYLGFKCLEFNQKRIAEKYQNNLNHFLSDLYHIQIKWASAGEFGYAESLGNLIKLHGNINPVAKPGGVGMPITNDSLSTDIQLKNLKKQELKDALSEIYETEFKG